ncbi:MAG: hypothetical protein LWX09_07105 [Bacteroidia bacterium]|nr:hypothetical protein [Bacteroidia bacterium]
MVNFDEKNSMLPQPSSDAFPALSPEMDRPTMEQLIAEFVEDLLRRDFGHLCQLMYRHDVDERRFNEALQQPDDAGRAREIARLVVDRELLKMKTRAAYAQWKQRNQLNPNDGD